MSDAHILVSSRLPTIYGEFSMDTFESGREEMPHIVLRNRGCEDDVVNVRIHSECLTGDLFGSTRCDCGEQLASSLRFIESNGGVLVYLRQEGRGIGLVNKLKAYNLQDLGHDTVDANLLLGHAADGRRYDVAAAMLANLGVRSIRLMTNNPAKIEGLQQIGVQVDERVALQVPVHAENERYLLAKAMRMRHLLAVS